jgi:hypothetical protein
MKKAVFTPTSKPISLHKFTLFSDGAYLGFSRWRRAQGDCGNFELKRILLS